MLTNRFIKEIPCKGRIVFPCIASCDKRYVQHATQKTHEDNYTLRRSVVRKVEINLQQNIQLNRFSFLIYINAHTRRKHNSERWILMGEHLTE